MAANKKHGSEEKQEPKVMKLPCDEETMDALIRENDQIGKELDEAIAAGAKAKKELDEEKDRLIRLMAEYDNYKKRTVKEKAQIYSDAKADALTAFLPMIDNLNRALGAPDEQGSMRKGVEMILNQAKETLANLGIEEIPALGQTFDPNRHNAAMHIEDPQYGEQEIVEVFQAGYSIGDKIIRHSVVKVAN